MSIWVRLNEEGHACMTANDPADIKHGHWESGWDWKTFERVETIAAELNARGRPTGPKFLPVDNGANVSPRYGVVQIPRVGDPVSYSFNGDTYPDGHVVKVTPTFQVKTSTGSTYLRRGTSPSWLKTGGTWYLVQGHLTERNPHF